MMLDTRNDYEIVVGTFRDVAEYNLKKLTEFPPAIAVHKDDFAGKTVVLFCTGGIRCEKVATHMQEVGIERIYQLEDGILEHLEEVGGTHYDGDYFVFDHCTALNAELQSAGLKQCSVCHAVVTPEEQWPVEYIPGQCCPHCAGSQTRATA